MGLFDFIGKATTQLKNDVSGGLNLLSAIGSHPIQATKGIVNLAIDKNKGSAELYNLVQKTKSEGAVKTIANTVVNTALVGSSLAVGSAAAGGTGIIAGAGKTIVAAVKAKPILLAAPIAAPIISNVITSSPKIQQQISKIDPGQFGSDIGKAIESPSLSNLSSVAKNNPVLSAVAGGAVVATIAGGTAGAISNLLTYENTKSVKENTKATLNSLNASIDSLSPEVKEVSGLLPTGEQVSVHEVLSPVVASGASTNKKKKKKKSTKKKKVYKKKKSSKKSKSRKKKKKR